MASEPTDIVITILQILVALINLGEQFGIYALQTTDEDNNQSERLFFFILFAVDGRDVFQSLFKSETIKTIMTMIVDTCELICYVSILHRTNALYTIAFLTYFFEILLNGIILFIIWQKHDFEKNCSSCKPWTDEDAWGYFSLCGLRLLAYLLCQLPQLLFLFLQSESKFRETYYEIIAIISLYVGAMTYDYLELLWSYALKKSQELNEKALSSVLKTIFGDEANIVQQVWNILLISTSTLLGIFVFPITTFVLAGIELRYNSGILPRRDIGIYIYFIVATVVWYLGLILLSVVWYVKKLRNSS